MIDRKAGLLQRTKEFFFPPPVASRSELQEFAAGEAAYLAQKTVIGYCRVKTMLDYDQLLKEAAFRDALEICRWEAYAGTLADTLILVEGLLRPLDDSARQKLADSIAALYPVTLDQTRPSHRADWADWHGAFAKRFALTTHAEPAHPDHVIEDTAKLIHELVPIHQRLKRNDLEVIRGDLRLHAVAMHASMLKRFRRDALVRELTA